MVRIVVYMGSFARTCARLFVGRALYSGRRFQFDRPFCGAVLSDFISSISKELNSLSKPATRRLQGSVKEVGVVPDSVCGL